MFAGRILGQSMKTFSTTNALTKYLSQLIENNYTIGLVPTMGALHKGHLSLVTKAMTENSIVVVSIFVNPTQFNNEDDLIKYPRTLENDKLLLESLNYNDLIIYAPSAKDIYNNEIKSKHYSFGGLEYEMEGAFREGHFDGVGTIVSRLLHVVNPNRAYFGEKDFQQLQIIKKLVKIEGLDVDIVGCPILREQDGLAMSSRNTRLKKEYRIAAPFIYKTLKSAKLKFGTKSAKEVTEWVQQQFENEPLLELEYFTIASTKTLKPIMRKRVNSKYRAFIAAYADDVRLIDNIALN